MVDEDGPIVSKAELARRLNVSKARISQFIATGLISGDALVGEGRNAGVRLELAKRQIATRRDVAQALGNGAATRLTPAPPSTPADLHCVKALTDLADRKAAALGLILFRNIGSSAACMAIEAGASVRVAFALKSLVEVSFVDLFEEALISLEVTAGGITYQASALSDVDWAVLAAKAGETVDMAAWEAWRAERLALMAAATEADTAPRH